MTSRLQARLLAQRALFQRLQSSKKRNKLQAGFTLIELLIVVVIIGILTSIALPSFLNQRQKAYESAADSWASGEARKCATAQALDDANVYNGEAPDQNAQDGGAPAGTPTCTVGQSNTFQGGTKTWTVDSAGGVSAS